MHCAASISFDLPLDEARQINVEGTREMIAFAREVKPPGGLDRFVHVSTAYVAGITEGTFRESQLDAGQDFRNTYEQTKWEAEHVVADATDLDPVIARPSIVMGESNSGWTPAFNVLYWPIRAFSRGLFESVPARPEAKVDVVPVDYVADALVHLLEHPSSTGVVNLVSGHEACTVEELVAMTATAFGKERPPVVPPGSTGTGSAHADDQAAVYFPYFDMDMVFDDAHARELFGPAGIRCPHLTDYFPRLIDYAQTTRWGKTPLTREEAGSVTAGVAGAHTGPRMYGHRQTSAPRVERRGEQHGREVHEVRVADVRVLDERRREAGEAGGRERPPQPLVAAPDPAQGDEQQRDPGRREPAAEARAIVGDERHELRVDRLQFVAGGLQEGEVGRDEDRRDPDRRDPEAAGDDPERGADQQELAGLRAPPGAVVVEVSERAW